MSDSLGGHHPRAADRLYCEECHQMFPCPGYLRALGVRLDDRLEAIVKRTAGMGLCSQTHHEHLMADARAALEPKP